MPFDLEQARAFLYREARHLDDREWDAWLECYAPEAVFWMPAWDDDGGMTTDPEREISLIYYGSRQGLEDRVFRIKTERSSASTPEPRTAHQISNVEWIGADTERKRYTVRFNWHTLSYRYKTTDSYFGTSEYDIEASGDTPRITRKHVVLKNDYIHHVIDVYHV